MRIFEIWWEFELNVGNSINSEIKEWNMTDLTLIPGEMWLTAY
jgi:hypothetical protein